MILYYLAAMIFLSLDMHHALLIGFQRSYTYLPVGGAQLREALFQDIVSRTGNLFLVALQMAAPMIAISFLITLIFSVLSRAVPQMNVFSENFAVRFTGGVGGVRPDSEPHGAAHSELRASPSGGRSDHRATARSRLNK
jgi:flagellar biosynthetic protein FliR